jgi:hypothetical protein
MLARSAAVSGAAASDHRVYCGTREDGGPHIPCTGTCPCRSESDYLGAHSAEAPQPHHAYIFGRAAEQRATLTAWQSPSESHTDFLVAASRQIPVAASTRAPTARQAGVRAQNTDEARTRKTGEWHSPQRGYCLQDGPHEFPGTAVAGIPAPALANSLHQHQATAVLGLTTGVYPDRRLRAGIPHKNQDPRQVRHQP